MAKITRKEQKVFGGNLTATNNIAQFGSLKAGSPAYSLDPDTIQSLSAYINGWAAAVVNNNAPALQDVNALDFLFSRQLAYLMQTGIAEWVATTTYYIGSMVNDGYGETYVSIVDDNLNNVLTDTTKWRRYITDASYLNNLSIAASVGGNALTLSLKNKEGADPSAASPANIAFRNSTQATGTYSILSRISSLSLVIADTVTLGLTATIADYLYVYAIDTDGTAANVKLGVISGKKLDEGLLQTSASSANTYATFYSDGAYSNRPVRYLGRIKIAIAASNHWTNAPTEISLLPAKTEEKVYLEGTTYNSVALNVTSAQAGFNVASGDGRFIPYKLAGNWRMKFWVYGTYTSANITSLTFSIAGVTFKNTNGPQPISGYLATVANCTLKAVNCQPNSSDMIIYVASTGNTSEFGVNGDVELEAKPTWADLI
jgi:hypothetical protein